MAGFSVSTISNVDELKILEPVWNSLLERSKTNSIFLSYEWITSCLRWIGQESEPLVLVAKDMSGTVCGIGPLMVTRSSNKDSAMSVIEFIGAPTSEYSDFIIAEDVNAVLTAFFDHLLKHPLWKQIRLREIPETSPTVPFMQNMTTRTGFHGTLIAASSCPTLILSGNEKAVQANLENKKYIGKRNRIRSLKYVETLGDFQIRHCASLEEAQAMVPHLIRLHKQRWGEESKFQRQGYEQLYSEVLARLWPQGRVKVTIAEFDKRPIAISLAFPYHGTWTNHNWVYDREFSKLSPGTLLIAFMIDDAIKQGYGEFDLTRGAEEYKRRFSNEIKQNVDLIIFRRMFTYVKFRSRRRWEQGRHALAMRYPRFRSGVIAIKRQFKHRRTVRE